MTTISLEIPETCRLSEDAHVGATSLLARFTSCLRSGWCRLNGGHFKVLYTEPTRLALRCVACGHTSPGWEVGTPRFARTIAGDKERLRLRRAA
jgi:hypothetical protein